MHCSIEDCNYGATHAEAAVGVVMLNIHGTTQAAACANAQVRNSSPSIALAGTAKTWSYFLTRWGEYKRGTKFIGSDVVTQLLECCEEDLRKYLTRAAGRSLVDKDEKDVLAPMRALAVHAESTMVARVALFNMQRDMRSPSDRFTLASRLVGMH